MNEIWKKKNGEYLRINVSTIPDDDYLIKRPFAYWHTRLLQVNQNYHFVQRNYSDAPDLPRNSSQCPCFELSETNTESFFINILQRRRSEHWGLPRLVWHGQFGMVRSRNSAVLRPMWKKINMRHFSKERGYILSTIR